MSGFCPCVPFSTLLKNLIFLQLMVSHVHVGAKGHNHAKLLTLSTAASVEIQATPFIHAALVSDLKVSAQVYNATRRLLQLLVSWKPPTSGRMPDDYNLHVYPMDKISHCATFVSYVVVDKNHTNATVPKIQDPVMTDVTRIRPGCTYKVVVESNPHNGRDNISVNYTVPECVGAICSCQHASTLPRPTNVKAVIAGPRHVDVSWRLPPSSSFNISKFVVSMGHQISWSQGRRQHLFNTSWVQDMEFFGDVDKGTHHVTQIVTHTDLVRNLTYRVEVFVVDSQRCEGPRTNYTFLVPLEENSKTSWLLVTVLSVVSFVVVFILATVTICQQCGSWARRKFGEGRLQPIKSWRGLYKAVNLERMGPHITRANFPIQEMNVLYVEKEIEEATLRGDADRYEISYARLELGRQIGKGAFGRVFLARAEAIAGIPGYITVAVKKLKHKATADEIEEFLSEIAMMKKVGHHPNIVTMLGCCTLKQPYCMIMEYIPCGDLLQYLRQLRVEYERRTGNLLSFTNSTQRPMPTHAPRYVHLQHHLSDSEGSYIQPDNHICASTGRPSIAETEWSLLSSEGASASSAHLVPHRKQLEYVLDPKELQNFAVQIARGMAHLEQKQITHRDLAARNVLIDGNKTLKISDFGLSRSGIYVNTKRKKVPLRWLSIEAMRDNLYSSKSDVWAFAIVLWEIGTLGGFPYPTVADIDLLNFLLDGKRLEKPDNCTDELYSLMLHCWSHSADARPSFADLVAHLDSVTNRKRVYVDFNSLRPDYSFPPTEQQAPALTSITVAHGTATITGSK